ncbi:endopeptidase, putative [Hepatocystis sp. ex Piliocolobus tephrosceles]|nr:endopeptidase, putative [Hepatocystis sp. ex Piliocolobus tephrosceles]
MNGIIYKCCTTSCKRFSYSSLNLHRVLYVDLLKNKKYISFKIWNKLNLKTFFKKAGEKGELEEVGLEKAELEEAKLEEAKLEEAKLEEAKLEEAKCSNGNIGNNECSNNSNDEGYKDIRSVDRLTPTEIKQIDNILAKIKTKSKNEKGEIEGNVLDLIGVLPDGQNLDECTDICIKTSDHIFKKMCMEKNIFKIINMVDTVSNNLCKLGDALELLRNLHNNKTVSLKAHESLEKLTSYIDKINIDNKIYIFLKNNYSNNKHLLDHEHKEVLLNMIFSMENQGVHIKSKKEKKKYLELQAQEKYIAYHSTFNYSNEYDGIYIEKKKLIPYIDKSLIKYYEEKINELIKNGYIKKNPQYPFEEYIYLLGQSSFVMTILENVKNENIRNEVFMLLKKHNKHFLKNILVLQYYRNMLIYYNNFINYNEYSLKNCILNTPSKVSYFLRNFLQSILPYFWKELQFIERYIDLSTDQLGTSPVSSTHLKETFIKEDTNNSLSSDKHPNNAKEINKKHIAKQNNNTNTLSKVTPANIFYYMNEIKKKKKLKKIESYMNKNLTLYDMIQFVITLLKTTYTLDMVYVKPLRNEIWNEFILKFEIKSNNYTYGYIYMDLFERENKSQAIAQYTVRCSKNMNMCLKYKWFEEYSDQVPFFYSGVVKTELDKNKNSDELIYKNNFDITNKNKFDGKKKDTIYRQTTSTFLVCNFGLDEFLNNCDNDNNQVNTKDEFPNNKITYFLKNIKMSIDRVNMFLHEFGHTLHCILSSTYLQHLSGNRSGIDFSEFSSHFFEEYLNSYEALLLLYCNSISHEQSHNKPSKQMNEYKLSPKTNMSEVLSNYIQNKNILCYYNIMQVTIQSIIDQIFYSLSHNTEDMEKRKELIEKAINNYFMGMYYKNIYLLDFFPQIHFSKTTHLVHYPANYYSYLYCVILSKYIWNRTFKNNIYDKSKASLVLHFLQRGSVDSSLKNIISLVEHDKDKIEYLTKNPHHIPLDDYLNYYGHEKEKQYNTFLESL